MVSFDVEEEKAQTVTKNIQNNESISFFNELNKLEDDLHTIAVTDRSSSPIKEAAVYLPHIHQKPQFKTPSIKITRRILSPMKKIDDKYKFSESSNNQEGRMSQVPTDRSRDLKDVKEMRDLKKRLKDAQTRSVGRIRKVEDYYYNKNEFAIRKEFFEREN